MRIKQILKFTNLLAYKRKILSYLYLGRKIEHLKAQISHNPLNSRLHLELGQAYSSIGMADLSIACYKTANSLGANISHIRMVKANLPLHEFPVDQYVRYKTVADDINSRYKGVKVLDVGGGAGRLSYFCLTKSIFLLTQNGME